MNYLDFPLVVTLCLDTLILHDITILRLFKEVYSEFFKYHIQNAEREPLQEHGKDGPWRTAGESLLSAEWTF